MSRRRSPPTSDATARPSWAYSYPHTFTVRLHFQEITNYNNTAEYYTFIAATLTTYPK